MGAGETEVWQAAGESDYKFYFTMGAPKETYLNLYDIACDGVNKAAGDYAGVLSAVWAKFGSGGPGLGVGSPANLEDNSDPPEALAFWNNNGEYQKNGSVEQILIENWGPCQSWAPFFIECVEVHDYNSGVASDDQLQSVAITTLTPASHTGYAAPNPFTGGPPYQDVGHNDTDQLQGRMRMSTTVGQNNATIQRYWYNHSVVQKKSGKAIYDPSYGTYFEGATSGAARQAWETHSHTGRTYAKYKAGAPQLPIPYWQNTATTIIIWGLKANALDSTWTPY